MDNVPSDTNIIELLDKYDTIKVVKNNIDHVTHLLEKRHFSILADDSAILITQEGYTKEDIIDILSAIVESLPEDVDTYTEF